MDNFDTRLSSWNQIEKNTALEGIDKKNTLWKMWWKTLIGLNVEDNAIKTRVNIIDSNGSNSRLVHKLDENTLLNPTDTNNARDHMENLSLRPFQPDVDPTASIRSATTSQHCPEHLDSTATNKCLRCKGLVCCDCRQQLTLGPSVVNYCQKCVDDVSCTIQ